MPKLAEWLKKNDLKPAEFAARIGVAKSTVYHWLDESSPTLPQREHRDLVYAETNGEVTFIVDTPRANTGVPESEDARQENKSSASQNDATIAMRENAKEA